MLTTDFAIKTVQDSRQQYHKMLLSLGIDPLASSVDLSLMKVSLSLT